jgi:hypothetical protein
MPLQDEIEDQRRPTDDHDLLIRLHERIIALASTVQSFIINFNYYGKRIETLEQFKANQSGIQTTNIRNAAIITTIISSVISGVLVYFFTH